MGFTLDRRKVLLGSVAAVGCAALDPLINFSVDTPPDDHRVGPMPHLPALPPRSYPYRATVLFTNGSIAYIDGYVAGLSINRWLSRGLARMIPYGLDVNSDARKLWLLGRSTFASGTRQDLLDDYNRHKRRRDTFVLPTEKAERRGNNGHQYRANRGGRYHSAG
jgi:hypothetical protein